MGSFYDMKEGNASMFGSSILELYRRIQNERMRALLRRATLRLEGGVVYSLTIREIFRRFHGVDAGLYTIGPCEVAPGNLPPGTTVGRYSSIYFTVRAFVHDFPARPRRGHGLFFEAALGEEKPENTAPFKLEIGHDVWIGHNAILLPSAERIGDGAVIGAGSVVQAPVPPYAVVTGNPARVVRYRFSEKTIQELIESQWWMRSIDDLSGELELFQKPLETAGPIR